MIRLITLLTILVSLCLPLALQAQLLCALDLRCEGISEPVGIDVLRPNLSWRLESERRGARQTAYAIRVASSAELLDKDRADLLDTGKTVATVTTFGYRASLPANHERFYWQVRVWDENDQPGPWSEVASWTMGMPDRHGWNADWITHPRWMQFSRPQLGYRSQPAQTADTPKWIQLDLGKDYPIDTIVLHALRYGVAERLGFPVAFIVEAARSNRPDNWQPILDTTAEPLNIWFTRHSIAANGIRARHVRLRVPVLRELNGEICLALAQIEVVSRGSNIAQGAQLSASDSIEAGAWSLQSLVDGMALPGANPVANRTIDLRREFKLADQPLRAMVHVAGLGGYIMEINGERVGDDHLKPGWSIVDATVFYHSYEVGHLLSSGDNAVALRLTPGMYSVADPGERYSKFVTSFRPPMARVKIWIQFADGSVQEIGSNTKWQAKEGAVTYSHIFGGEDYDARLQPADWSKAGLASPTGWVAAATSEAPRGWMRGASGRAPAIVHVDELVPIAHRQLRPGVAVYDLGQNASIMVRLTATGNAGDRIRIIPAELLAADGSVDRASVAHRTRPAWWQYTLAGGGNPEHWQADFFYHGARYLQVERYPEQPGGSLPEVTGLHGLVTHSAAPAVGEFSSSSTLYNRIRELVRWAQRSNMVSVLTDCPHRERLGWLEQYHLNGPGLRYEFGVEQLYLKTLNDMVDAQTPAGLVPNIAPEYIIFEGAFRDSPEWGSALVLATWQQYLFTGDASVLTRYYNPMQQYVAYLKSKSDAWILDHGLGDWYDLGPAAPGFSQLTPRSLTATAIFYECVHTLWKIADMRGRQGEAAAYREWADAIRAAFNLKFLDPATGIYATGSQTAQAMPWAIGLVPDELRASVLEELIEAIRREDGAHTAGDVGHRYVLRALAAAGRSDLIHAMHHQTQRPGYGWQLERGATSLVEAWDANRRASQNHFMLGHITEWFYADLVGIQPCETEPGFRHVIVNPQPVTGVDQAAARYLSINGPIAVEWQREAGGSFSLSVSIPANCRATLLLPADAGTALLESGKPAGQQDGIVSITPQGNRMRIEIGSGNYTFTSQFSQ